MQSFCVVDQGVCMRVLVGGFVYMQGERTGIRPSNN